MKKFLALNFGCRVNSAELNQLSQLFIDAGFTPCHPREGGDPPSIVVVNTCAITKKGERESIGKIKNYLKANIPVLVTGCANLSSLSSPLLTKITNQDKEKILSSLNGLYTSQVKDKFSHTNRYLLKVQSGCTTNCTFCIVPFRRPTLNSLSIDDAVATINSATDYTEVIITGVNLAQYKHGLSNLVEALLTQTKIPLISFGSVPVLCVDDKFIDLYRQYPSRLSSFLHIPIQSGSDKILKLMHRPYNVKKIKEVFKHLKLEIRNLTFGSDIIVGFPGENDHDFLDTYNLCQEINFSKIHVFKYSPRPDTPARQIFLDSPKISKEVLKLRSSQLRKLSSLIPQSF